MHGAFLRITTHLVIPYSEIDFRTSRSSGPGGQNVNKLETKVDLLFDVFRSASLSELQRSILLDHLKGRIDSSGILRVSEQRSRSQFQNKEQAINRFVQLLQGALRSRKPRVRTKPTTSSKERRLQFKRRTGEKKRLRRSLSE